MSTIGSELVRDVLQRLHSEAEAADRGLIAQITGSGVSLEDAVSENLARERVDYRALYRDYARNFLSVSVNYGNFLYAVARACKANRIVEFGTSMGVSTIYLAAALRDNGGGTLIGSELETTKVARARTHIHAAGLSDLVEIRQGDALDTLADVSGRIDLLLLDGAFALYLPVLRLLETRLRPGAVILGENAFEPAYLGYVRDAANGYVSQPLAADAGRGNEFTIRTPIVF